MQSKCVGRRPHLSRHNLDPGIARIDEKRNERRGGDQFVRQLHSLGLSFPIQFSHASDVALGLTESRDELDLHRTGFRSLRS